MNYKLRTKRYNAMRFALCDVGANHER
jgi:hypothetical protein